MSNHIFSHTNKEIELHREQQLLIFERYKVTQESYNYHHEIFMKYPTQENELKALKAFEFLTYDKQAISLHVQRELEERLRVANNLLQENGIEVPKGYTSITE